jgi:cold shock protein
VRANPNDRPAAGVRWSGVRQIAWDHRTRQSVPSRQRAVRRRQQDTLTQPGVSQVLAYFVHCVAAADGIVIADAAQRLLVERKICRRRYRVTMGTEAMPTGTVKWFNATKGFGFIQPESGGKDVFVHITAVQAAGLKGLNDGQRVSYEVQMERGKESAGNLKLA